MRTITSLIFSLFFLCSFSQDLELELLASNFNRPVSIKHAGDNRLFVVEQDGLIRIINSNGTVQTESFLDIDNIVINTGNERGLLGLAFHPNYATNGYFFVNYINNSGNTVVSRFTLDTNTSLADPNSEFIIITYNQPFGNHNGGDLAFGPDGYLYISSGVMEALVETHKIMGKTLIVSWVNYYELMLIQLLHHKTIAFRQVILL